MRMRQFTTRQLILDIRITLQKWKPDPKVSLKHDDLYARGRECEYEQPIFDAKNAKTTQPNSIEISRQSDLLTEKMWITPGTAQGCSREVFPLKEELSDVTHTCPYQELGAKTSPEQLNKNPTNSGSSKYKLRYNPKPNCNDDYRY